MSNWLVKKAEMEDVPNTLYKEIKRQPVSGSTNEDIVIVQDKSNDEYLVGINLSEDMSGHDASEIANVERFNNLELAEAKFNAYIK